MMILCYTCGRKNFTSRPWVLCSKVPETEMCCFVLSRRHPFAVDAFLVRSRHAIFLFLWVSFSLTLVLFVLLGKPFPYSL
ncbi:hypothetical protein BCR43DRAFT_488753 [Syncephalastrum racemosum]|uniref:Uncharacterized protein n=1 Tax=Syncephalastrum racemosum TaxID=13706 RepID=A0A1X2HJ59_SYNRA|nr:hypothetical protein BCR43DRAFT_488753 [Syncephalastrum racemosum]